MQIDWFTLIAQVVNFLVLVWLLKRFLYGRVIRAMDEREAKIAARLDEAAQKRAEAEQDADRFRAKERELDEQRELLLVRAREEAETRRQQTLEETRRDVEQIQAEWIESLQQEKQQFLEEFRERIGSHVFTIVRRALKDLANAELQQQMIAAFLDRIERLERSERDVMVGAIRAAEHEVELRSAFPIAAEMREQITQRLREQLDDGAVVRFEIEPAIGCGIEIYAHSHRLVWNLESYLEALEESFFQKLEDMATEHGQSQRERFSRSNPGAASSGVS